MGGRKSIYPVQAKAMEQEQVRLENIVAVAGTCFGTRSNALPIHPDLTPKPHTRTSQGNSEDRQRRTFYTDLYRGS